MLTECVARESAAIVTEERARTRAHRIQQRKEPESGERDKGFGGKEHRGRDKGFYGNKH